MTFAAGDSVEARTHEPRNLRKENVMEAIEVVYAEGIDGPPRQMITLLRVEGEGGPLTGRAWRLSITRLYDGAPLVTETRPTLGEMYSLLAAVLGVLPEHYLERVTASIRVHAARASEAGAG